MKKYLILLLLLIPQVCDAVCLLPNYCRRFQLPGWWGSGEYLLTWRKERYYPPLVSTEAIGTGVILFGDKYYSDSPKSGGRGDLGFWMLPCFGFGATFFALGEESVHYSITGDASGNPTFGRPYFDANGTSEFDVISEAGSNGSGFIGIKTTNDIWCYDLYTRYRYLETKRIKVDFLAGFRSLSLRDDLNIATDTTNLGVGGEQTHEEDHFRAKNDYYAGVLGVIGEARTCNWGIQVIGKVGLGNMVRNVDISGLTRITQLSGLVTETNVGFLATTANIGKHSHNKFEVIPEINAQLQLRIWSHMWLTAGYQYIFWPSVFLSGEAANIHSNINTSPPEFSYLNRTRSFWTQGFTTGIYILY